MQVGQNFLAFEQITQALGALVGQNADLILQIALQAIDLFILDGAGAFVFLLTLAGEDFAIDHSAFNARRAVERGVLHVAGLFAEDRA